MKAILNHSALCENWVPRAVPEPKSPWSPSHGTRFATTSFVCYPKPQTRVGYSLFSLRSWSHVFHLLLWIPFLITVKFYILFAFLFQIFFLQNQAVSTGCSQWRPSIPSVVSVTSSSALPWLFLGSHNYHLRPLLVLPLLMNFKISVTFSLLLSTFMSENWNSAFLIYF